jgi:FixJ family two-component response regulator
MTGATARGRMAEETVYIVDDDASIRESLSNLLEAVGVRTESYESVEAFQERWKMPGPGCLLLDGRLPGMSGTEFQERLVSTGEAIPIIFMTAHGDMHMVRKVLKAGAVEFLIKPFQKEELLRAVEQAFARDRARREEELAVETVRERIRSLTDRERQVMQLVTSGLLNKQIAAELNISEITVKLHRRHVMDGMRAGSLAELVKMCERAKFPSWTPPRSDS